MAVPYTFGSATTSIPLSQLDSNFATAITLGNTAVQLGNTITNLTGVSNVASATSLSLGSNGNTTAVTIDTAQNVGVGATPPTSDLGKSITINTAGNSLWSSQANQTDLLANATYNGGWKFVSSSSNYANRISVGNANGQYAWQTSSAAGTSGNAITFNQLMTLNTNGVLGLYGGSTTANGVGIAFPATQSASSDANTLDDYEEGTFTPTIAFGGGSTGITYDNQRAVYTKVGNRVFITCYVSITNKGSSTGSVTINGLPFASLNSTNLYNNSAIWGNNLTGIIGGLQGYCGPNSTSISEIGYLGTGSQTVVTNSNFGNTSGLMVNFSYSIN